MSKLRVVLLAAFAACAVSAAASASASALEFYVHHVLLQGLLHIESSLRSTESVLKTTDLGEEIEITCPALDNVGWIDNGIKNNLLTGLGLVTVNFLKCTVPKPSSEHCEVANKGLIVATSLVELITDGDVYALFLPDPTGANFTAILFAGCKQAAFNAAPFPITGNAAGLAENGISSLNFKPGVSPDNGLKFSGAAATLSAVDLVLMEGGGAIELL